MNKEIIKVNKRNQFTCGWRDTSEGRIIYVEIDGLKREFLCPPQLNSDNNSTFFYGYIVDK